MSIIKLPDEGDQHVGTVKHAESVQGQYGMQVKFTFTNGDQLFLPYDSAIRQLCRAGFDGGQDENGEDVADLAAVAGETLLFARTHNPKKGAKPFWDVSVANGAEKKAQATPSKRLTGPTDDDQPPAHHRESGVPDRPPSDRLEAAMAEVGLGDPSATDAEVQHDKRMAVVHKYTALYELTAKEIARIGRELDFPVDGTSVQAATATIWITLKDRNLV